MASLLSVFALTRLAVGLEPPSVPGAAAPYAPIRLRGNLGPPLAGNRRAIQH
ncbi:MAG: hypothetical protein QOD12_3056 [Verrucomicrobiota bacterium]